MRLAQAGRQASPPSKKFFPGAANLPGSVMRRSPDRALFSTEGLSLETFAKREAFSSPSIHVRFFGAKNPTFTSTSGFSERKIRCLRQHSILRSKNSDAYVNIRQNGTKTPSFTSTSDFTERKLRCLRQHSTKWREKSVVYVNIGFCGAKRVTGMGFSMKTARKRRYSSDLWQNYATAKAGAMVIPVSGIAGMHRRCQRLAT